VYSHRQALLPIVCQHAQIDSDMRDECGITILHALAAVASAPGHEQDGVALLRALLAARPQLYLFATNGSGRTALGATPSSSSQVFALLLDATRRAIASAVIAIVCCRREQRTYDDAAHALKDFLEASFTGLTVLLRPLAGMRKGDEGCAGSFEVLWEAADWKHSRLLYSRLATGRLPRPESITRAVLLHLLGPTTPLHELESWHSLIGCPQPMTPSMSVAPYLNQRGIHSALEWIPSNPQRAACACDGVQFRRWLPLWPPMIVPLSPLSRQSV
jgi:hypothetical protein